MELWTYYKVTLGGNGAEFLIRVTGESGGQIFGLEVDEYGKSVRRSDGTLRFRIFDREAIAQMIPLTLLSGRLVAADKSRKGETKPKATSPPA